MFEQLLDQRQINHTIITVNQRLSLSISREYQAKQQQAHRAAWPALSIMPLSAWLETWWLSHSDHTHSLLNAVQERALWQDIVQSDDRYSLIQPTHTAQLAQQAWMILNQWQFTLDDLLEEHNQEVSTFVEWAQRFLSHCDTHHWQSSACLIADLLPQLPHITWPEQLTWVGFDEFTPAQATLIEQLSAFTSMQYHEVDIEPTTTHTVALTDTLDEIHHMARWAKQHWQCDPQQRIGCVVPDLTALRDKIEAVFIETFNHQQFIDDASYPRRPFNLSASRPLYQYPLIHDAMATLRLLQTGTHVPLSLCRQWLMSPYCQQHLTDEECAAAIDTQLSRYGKAKLPHQLIQHTLTKLHSRFPQSSWLARWQHVLHTTPVDKQAPSAWSRWVAQQLHALHWPGNRAIDSTEHQLVHQLQQQLVALQALDEVTPMISYPDFLQRLKDLLINTPFQPEGSDTPIQILGVLEASGYAFDHLWVMNLTDTQWPTPPKTNPFLPTWMQQQHQMPQASAQRELQFTQKLTQRLVNSSANTILSYARQEGDRQQQPSPLITHYQPMTPTQLALSETSHQAALQRIPLTAFDDFTAPTVQPHENPKGGTWILKQQAHCPFKAFASVRLQATTKPSTDLGINPALKGSLVHRALECIWETLTNSQQLQALTHDQQTALIEQAITRSISDIITPHTQLDSFVTLEAQRLATLLHDWLDYEKQRPPFQVIAREKRDTITWQGLTFRVTIDRIDQLSQGDLLVIDYKTQYTHINHWFGERLEEPQLPIYSLSQQQPIHGVAFAQLKPGQLTFKGIVHERMPASDHITGCHTIDQAKQPITQWEECLQHWKTSLEQLVTEFKHGHANVQPLNASSCRYCDCQPLCRVFEQ